LKKIKKTTEENNFYKLKKLKQKAKEKNYFHEIYAKKVRSKMDKAKKGRAKVVEP